MNEYLNSSTGLRGRMKVEVIDHNGRVVDQRPWQPNLLLNQGLDALATVPITELFKYAVKGTTTNNVKEVVANSNTYSLNTGTSQVTRTAGTRDFTSGDIGKLIRSSDGRECVIVSAGGDPTIADVVPVGLNNLTAFTNKAITLYYVHLDGMAGESGRTNTYSSITGDNGTTKTVNVWKHKRTFLFDPENANIETPGIACTWTGTTVTRVTGARNFTTADKGKYISFAGDTEYAKITDIVSVSAVTVDRAPTGTVTALPPKIYGFQSYGQIGYSHLGTAGNNLNILVRLEDSSGNASPVMPLGDNPETPGQQVRVTYELTVTFGPNTVSATTSSNITDPAKIMSTNKNGKFSLEGITASFVDNDGDSDLTSLGLEPCQGGYVALSPVSGALVPVHATNTPPDRSAGAVYVPLVNQPYNAGEYTILSEGTFGINEGNAQNWRSLGIYDPDSEQFLFTFLFDTVQKKPGTHQLTVRFRKSWNRDLS